MSVTSQGKMGAGIGFRTHGRLPWRGVGHRAHGDGGSHGLPIRQHRVLVR